MPDFEITSCILPSSYTILLFYSILLLVEILYMDVAAVAVVVVVVPKREKTHTFHGMKAKYIKWKIYKLVVHQLVFHINCTYIVEKFILIVFHKIKNSCTGFFLKIIHFIIVLYIWVSDYYKLFHVPKVTCKAATYWDKLNELKFIGIIPLINTTLRLNLVFTSKFS